jgi:predicted DNA-binding transcriptional regulator AlpA
MVPVSPTQESQQPDAVDSGSREGTGNSIGGPTGEPRRTQVETWPTVKRTGKSTPKPLLSVEETALLLGESRSAVYRSIQRGDLPLPVFRLNGRLRVPRRAVERLLAGDLPIPHPNRVPM